MPTNQNMRNEKLRALFTELGFKNVGTVIASGNVVFNSDSKNPRLLEKKIEAALPEKLNFSSTTIIRSENELLSLVKKNPFKGVKDEKPNYLVVTFFKNNNPELASVVDLNNDTGTKMMSALEKKYGKEITTRTWKTVHRILKKMETLD